MPTTIMAKFAQTVSMTGLYAPPATSSVARVRPAPSPPSPAPPSPPPGGAVLAEQWPTLSAALHRYERTVAEDFSRQAYACVHNGLIRLDDRRRLAAQAADMGIRPFDAQLLIACAIRQWSLDHQHEFRRSTAPEPIERRLRRRLWLRVALAGAAAAALDVLIVWRFLM